MLYDKYKNRMIAVRKARNFLYRFRVLFISSASLVLATTITLLSIKGIPLKGTAISKEVTYGDELVYSDNALFNSDVTYEFSPADKEAWTFSSPSRPGEWKMRSVSTNGFGGKYYGGINTFTILPKNIEVKVAESSLEYGEKPTLYSSLISGDTFTNYDVNFSSYSSSSVEVTPNLDSITITNSKGEDVTSCYSMTFVSSSLAIKTRPLSIEIQDQEKEYDAQKPFNFSYLITGGSLAYSDTLSVDYGSVSSSVGSYSIDGVATIKNKAEEDVTSLYAIHLDSGNMMINKRSIALTSSSASKIYDGSTLAKEEVKLISGNLASGDAISYAFTNEENKYVGDYVNSFTTRITNSDGNDVTASYAISPTYGTLSITKRPLQVMMPTTNFGVYDGIYHEDLAFKCDNLASTDHYILRSNSQIKNAGNVINKALGSVVDASGKDVSSNYDISFNDGRLTIDPRPITIKATDASKVYDGTLLSSSTFAITNGSLANNDLISATPLATLTSAGTLKYQQSYVITNNSGEDVTSSYSITPQEGVLNVSKRPLSLTVTSTSKTYDGTPLKASAYSITSGSLASGHNISISSYNGSIIHFKDNDQVSTILEKDIKITSDAEDVTKNYDINVITSYLKIDQRDITLSPNVVSGLIYDGRAHAPTAFSILSGSLASGDTISGVNFSIESTQTNAGTYATNIDPSSPIIIKNANGEVVYSYLDKAKADYRISFTPSSLEIKKRPINALTYSASKIYDGLPLSSPYIAIKPDSPYKLVDGHSFFVPLSAYTSITRAGTIINTVLVNQIHILDNLGQEVTSNYQINVYGGSLTVNKRPLSLVSTGFSIDQYDGSYHSGGTFSIASGSLANGESISYSEHQSFIYAGTYQNLFSITITNPTLGDVTDCYDLTYSFGEVTIGKRPLSIKTNSSTWEYDSFGHQNSTYSFLDGTSLASTDNLYFTFGSVIDVGTYPNKPLSAYIFNNSFSLETTNSYAITYKEVGNLTINKKSLTITSQNITKSYDATWNGDVTKVTYSPIASNDTITFYDNNPSFYSGKRPDVGVYTNHINYSITRTGTNQDVSGDYDISISYGSFTITKANLVVKLSSTTEQYNGTGSSVNGNRNDTARSVTSGTLLAGDGRKFTFLVVGDTVDGSGHSTYVVGTSSIVAKSFTLTHPLYGDVASNFNVTIKKGTMTRSKRPLSISTGDVITIAGYTYTSDPYISEGSVAQGDTIIFSNEEKEAITAGSFTNSIDLTNEVKIINAKGEDMTYCYDLSIGSFGALIVLSLE
jgi:hypothetical protein